MTKNHIIIGDIHGCLHELQSLWQKLPLNEQTQIILLGDLIDRGPDSEGVVQFIQNQAQLYDIVIVQGNHELKRLRQYQRGVASVIQQLSSSSWEFLKNNLVPFYRFEHLKKAYIAVHAGIFPAFIQTYAELPNPSEKDSWPRKLHERLERFTICRYVNPSGNIVAMGQEQDTDAFWADVYTGEVGYAFFGHQPYLTGIRQFNHATGIDTGCVFGGELTAICLRENDVVECLSVPAQQSYASLQHAFDEGSP